MEPWRTSDVAVARSWLTACCGSPRWIERMIARVPFASLDDAVTAAREEWFALTPDDWREAFKHHPKIGDRESLRQRFPATHQLSEREQSGVSGASDAVLDDLAQANRHYEARFGYIFIVYATGKSASDMLDILRGRLRNDPAIEIRVAAEEQAKVTELRLRNTPPPRVPPPPGRSHP
jgi:2-oxo-4-hydroxy-4-carboxy-5-ureidoimidazoline decarboxylase